MDWDQATDIILYASFAVLAVFAFLGLYQLVTRKSFKKVDKQLRWMVLPLALMAITYVVFDKFLVLNTRPNGSGEPSFPSTHVMVVSTIFFLAILNLPRYVKSKPMRIIIEIAMVIFAILTCAGRILSDMHWPSDCLGALVFAFVFVEIYYLIIKKGAGHAKHLHENHQ